jgi:hypothetical protein
LEERKKGGRRAEEEQKKGRRRAEEEQKKKGRRRAEEEQSAVREHSAWGALWWRREGPSRGSPAR